MTDMTNIQKILRYKYIDHDGTRRWYMSDDPDHMAELARYVAWRMALEEVGAEEDAYMYPEALEEIASALEQGLGATLYGYYGVYEDEGKRSC